MNIKSTSLLSAAVMGLCLQTAVQASQQSSVELGELNVDASTQQPNFYECSGRNINLTLAVGGGKAEASILPAQTSLNLEIAKKRYSFQEADIASETTSIGTLWQVVLNMVPDDHSEYASLVVPNIVLANAPVKFKSQLILTKEAMPLSFELFRGVVNASKYVDLNCTASMVYY